MVTETQTEAGVETVIELLLKTARTLFEDGQERTEAIAGALRQHDVFLTRGVLLQLAFQGLGSLFDAATKVGNIKAGRKVKEGTARFSGNGGGAVLPPSTGIGEVLSAGITSVLMKYAKTKTVFGKQLCSTDTDFMRSAAERVSRQLFGWTLSESALLACVPIYEKHLTGKQTFSDLPTSAQEQVAELLSDADAARKGTPLTEL